MSGQTEAGRAIHGLLFVDTPWVFWEIENSTACCERCGTHTEVWKQGVDPQPCEALLAFWSLHMKCEVDGEPPIEHALEPEVKQKRLRKAAEADRRMLLVFPAGNRVKYTQIIKTDMYGKPVEEEGIGLPHGITFEVKRVDGRGAWMYCAGLSRGPGNQLIHVPWSHE
jgi:hypothetical protein